MEDIYPVDIEFIADFCAKGDKRAHFKIRGVSEDEQNNFYIFLAPVDLQKVLGTKYAARRKTKESIVEDWNLWCGWVPEDAR